MDNNDFDIDKLFDDQNAFKPLTKGLGFHHSLKSEEEVSTNLKKSSEQLRNDLERRAKSLNTNISVRQESVNLDRGDLSPFYSNEVEVKKPVETITTAPIKFSEKASVVSRLGAFIIDFSLVLAMHAITLVLITFAAGLDINLFLDSNLALEFCKQTSPLFVFYYLFYFSFFDKTSYSTLGKRALGLKVSDEKGELISMFQAFLRSFLTLISVASLGLFSLLDFQSKMTETKVVKR